MNNFSSIISNIHVELNLLKQRISEVHIISSGLRCPCKTYFLDKYINLMLDFSVLIVGVLQISKYKYNERILHSIWDAYSHDIENIIYNSTHSLKMSILFHKLQSQYNLILFNKLKESVNMIRSNSMSNDELLSFCALFTDNYIYSLVETSIFQLAGLRIHCDHIKDNITADHGICLLPKTVNCYSPKNNECLHLFFDDMLLPHSEWFMKYFDVFRQYHKRPDNIKCIFDLKLVSNMTWNNTHQKLYQHGKDIFNDVFVVNYDHLGLDADLNYTPVSFINDCYDHKSECG